MAIYRTKTVLWESIVCQLNLSLNEHRFDMNLLLAVSIDCRFVMAIETKMFVEYCPAAMILYSMQPHASMNKQSRNKYVNMDDDSTVWMKYHLNW